MKQPTALKKIVLVSSGQPGANPRLVKEALALAEAGYQLTVIYCALSPWADKYDEELIAGHPEINWIKIGSTQHSHYYRLRQKIYQELVLLFKERASVAIRSRVLYSQELIAKAKQHSADLYIGHNLGALPAVVLGAEKHQAKAAFDFEDYHRGEHPENSIHWQRVKTVEDKWVPRLSYATAASPLIAAAYKKLYAALSITAINNYFPVSYSVSWSALPSTPLKLFWFSQFVGSKRGLETVIEAMGKTGNREISLTLLGNANDQAKKHLLCIAERNGLGEDQLVFLNPVKEADIVKIAAEHHIGLASEIPHIINRDLCLTNKIFMYLLAGNAVIFSKTKAQQDLLKQHPGIGLGYHYEDASELAGILNSYLADGVLLQRHRAASYELGSTVMNWDTEKKRFLEQVKNVLS